MPATAIFHFASKERQNGGVGWGAFEMLNIAAMAANILAREVFHT